MPKILQQHQQQQQQQQQQQGMQYVHNPFTNHNEPTLSELVQVFASFSSQHVPAHMKITSKYLTDLNQIAEHRERQGNPFATPFTTPTPRTTPHPTPRLISLPDVFQSMPRAGGGGVVKKPATPKQVKKSASAAAARRATSTTDKTKTSLTSLARPVSSSKAKRAGSGGASVNKSIVQSQVSQISQFASSFPMSASPLLGYSTLPMASMNALFPSSCNNGTLAMEFTDASDAFLSEYLRTAALDSLASVGGSSGGEFRLLEDARLMSTGTSVEDGASPVSCGGEGMSSFHLDNSIQLMNLAGGGSGVAEVYNFDPANAGVALGLGNGVWGDPTEGLLATLGSGWMNSGLSSGNVVSADADVTFDFGQFMHES
ncbi:hypothetical protein HDU98_004424 [Podochytrium sp. JEL0797]|nr:hypothetical protein HDU98_004424 [Podochytrium sp. JEL0797]